MERGADWLALILLCLALIILRAGHQTPPTDPQTPPAGPQTPPAGPHALLAGPRTPLASHQTPSAGPQTPLTGPQPLWRIRPMLRQMLLEPHFSNRQMDGSTERRHSTGLRPLAEPLLCYNNRTPRWPSTGSQSNPHVHLQLS